MHKIVNLTNGAVISEGPASRIVREFVILTTNSRNRRCYDVLPSAARWVEPVPGRDGRWEVPVEAAGV